ncbi:hypothetical protein GGI26_000764 [Coemansia sp. RSA 1358]|nr:CRAL-TRIO domain-containing protein [Coemansia spiralis]KAJ1991923.1 hypothetical protein EDC05_003077 [Coemansia umbellata]KAJ2625294.1 hypothetical protein GGI26_000764 [Coemansia sp. RSA 1358]
MAGKSAVDLDNPTPEQKAEAIAGLRAKLSDELNEYCNDVDIWRFCVARQLDTEKSAAMANEWYEWRKTAKVDAIEIAHSDNTYPPPYPIRGYYSVADSNITAGAKVKDIQLKMAKYFGGGCWHKRDKEGHPIYIERVGLIDLKSLFRTCTTTEMFEFHLDMQEFLSRSLFRECSQLAGKEISKQVVIFDLDGLSIGMVSHIQALNMLREMLSKDQLRYPEYMHRTFIVNMPTIFLTAWKLIKTWVDPRVISKIHILGRNDTKELLEHVSADNLPVFLGGSCRCSHMPGGCVPCIAKNNLPDLPRRAFTSLHHQVQLSYSNPHHSFDYDVVPSGHNSNAAASAISSPVSGYASWFGIGKSDSPKYSPSAEVPSKIRIVFVRFTADRGRGVVVEVLWRSHGAATESGLLDPDDEVLVYPETLLDPQRAPILLELKVPNRAGHMVINWRVANFDEGQAPFPNPEEAQIPIQLEYSIDLEEDLLKEFNLPPIQRD